MLFQAPWQKSVDFKACSCIPRVGNTTALAFRAGQLIRERRRSGTRSGFAGQADADCESATLDPDIQEEVLSLPETAEAAMPCLNGICGRLRRWLTGSGSGGCGGWVTRPHAPAARSRRSAAISDKRLKKAGFVVVRSHVR